MSYKTGIINLINDAFLANGKIIKGEAECLDIELKGNYIIIKTDNKDFNEKVIKTIFKKGEARCICDYIIISDSIVLVCELKSNNEGKMKTQLKNTGKLVKYLLEMVKEHCDVTIQEPPIKYVCFGKMYGESR